MGLTLWSFIQGGELKKCFLNRSIIVNMNGVLEHVVDKVWTWLYEIVESR